MDNSTDPELVARFRAGDARAFDEIVTLHQDRVRRLVYRLLGWSDDVEDVVQDVFVCVLQKLHQFHGNARFSTWLTTIAVNTCRSHQRRRLVRLRNLPRLLERFQGIREANNSAESAENLEEVRQAVCKLSAKYREPIVLRYFEELSIGEIGKILEISESAVEMRLSRARRQLKAGLLTDSGERSI
ncbi:MAG: RNA polymerase sigma factor [Planctomycetota bacterium]